MKTFLESRCLLQVQLSGTRIGRSFCNPRFEGVVSIIIVAGQKANEEGLVFMFDTLRPKVLADTLSDAIYKWRGFGGWPESRASVYACIWTPDAELGGGVGNYQVLFSYPAEDEIQAGTLSINGLEGCPPYRTGDAFTLRYHPRHPSRFYYANEVSRTARIGLVVLAVAVGGLAAFIMISLFPK